MNPNEYDDTLRGGPSLHAEVLKSEDMVRYDPINIRTLAILVPCFNEEDVLHRTVKELTEIVERLISEKLVSNTSKIYFIDDGSKDKTWSIIKNTAQNFSNISGIKLSCNKGHQNALYAGLCLCSEDLVVSIDADLQDNPECIREMVLEYYKGNDVVYGVRTERTTDSAFKRFSAEGYYRLMRTMGVDLIFNHADFRLLSRRVVEAFKEYTESNLFLRGLVREIGYDSAVVSYSRSERIAGETKYPLMKMLSFAWNGITSFSTVPLRLITVLGLVASFISIGIIFWVVGVWMVSEDTVPGWASILLPLLFIGSVQLVCLGVVGEYIAKLYSESKRRPKYHVSEKI